MAQELTPQAREQLQRIHATASNMLSRLKELLPPGYRLTLIARHPDMPDAQMVVTEEADEDLEFVVNALMRASSRL